MPDRRVHLLLLSVLCCLPACRSSPPAEPLARYGDEIIVAGHAFRVGTPVVLWTDPGGYDAYRTEARFAPRGQHRFADIAEKVGTPNRYGLRFERTMSDQQFARHRGGKWTLEELQQRIDLFVIHYDACGTCRRCFEVLHDHRGLSVHFMLDVDGTIYQTLDLKERAWHAGPYNDRSVGIEIANIGAFPPKTAAQNLSSWYRKQDDGRTQLIIPEHEKTWIRTPDFVGFSSRDDWVAGPIHRREVVQYDLTPQQYQALIRLTEGLSRALPRIQLRYPQDEQGRPRNDLMTEAELAEYAGLVGHYHLTEYKIDPGPAFQWDHVVNGARGLSD
ncbi:MAG: N-acetylmuramoyl-L-alanine amidase [Planctomycetota bacterium]